MRRTSSFTIMGRIGLSLAGIGCHANAQANWEKLLAPSDGGGQKECRICPALDDWSTGGDWIGRYGEYAWVLCGMSGVWDYKGGEGIDSISYRAYIGENRSAQDGVRSWVHWPYLPAEAPEATSAEEREKLRGRLGSLAPQGMDLWNWSGVRRVLLNPVNGGRRQSSWDDHAEGYSPWFDRGGPNLYVDLRVPDGRYLVSLYFVNKDAHWGPVNRYRDYSIQVKQRRPEFGKGQGWEQAFAGAQTLVQERVHDFHAGVYKRFYLTGPADVTFGILKGDSINTILSALFVDRWIPERDLSQIAHQSSREAAYGLVTLKERSPLGFLELAPRLAGEFALSASPRSGELIAERFDRLEALGTLLEILLQYRARDAAWRSYGRALADWVNEADQRQLSRRRQSFWERCRRADRQRLQNSAALSEMYGQYFRCTLDRIGEGRSTQEIRSFVRWACTARPHLARAALRELVDHYQRQGDENPRERFGPEELFAWAQCHRQLGDHVAAAHFFEEFVVRFPRHERAATAARRLPTEVQAARNQERLRNQDFTIAKPAGRPR